MNARRQRAAEPDAELGADGLRLVARRRRIAFASERDRSSEVYVMNADGSGQRRLTRNARDAWSCLVARRADDRLRERRDGNVQTHVMNADGSGQRTSHEARGTTQSCWSPDGRRIAFARGMLLRRDRRHERRRKWTAEPTAACDDSCSPGGRPKKT